MELARHFTLCGFAGFCFHTKEAALRHWAQVPSTHPDGQDSVAGQLVEAMGSLGWPLVVWHLEDGLDIAQHTLHGL